ncbi:MAG: NAD(P)(+) transhydrogenase (Re/Si-specific) subunit beta, partial [Candidatus Dormibacteraceae bacterium]
MSILTGIGAAYLIAAIGFILALKGLTSPRTARYGNLIGAGGMILAVGLTFAQPGLRNFGLIAIGMVIGVALAVPAARMVKMTAMPQMVAVFNGVGGGAAALVSVSEFARQGPASVPVGVIGAVLFSVVVGSVSFAGSGVAFAKLQELMTGRPITYAGQQVVNGIVGAAIVALAIWVLITGSSPVLVLLLLLALLFGVAFVLPIGGADMPVVISLLNSFTGLAVAASGFVLQNTLLIVAGTLVGASGGLLTRMMSRAMGRSLANILFGAFGAAPSAGAAVEAGGDRSVRSGTPEDIGTLLAYSHRVVIVPGYGLAVAQAQHAARELADLLEKRGVEVRYGIHPVAGRMPGHMNVLLAEANVPYEQLREMDEINPQFPSTDVALVVGANDVVNPAARETPGSPIYGMPILNVDEATNVVFLKRSMRPGFAGIDNSLLYSPRTVMLFGDAKDTLTKLVAAVKA